MRLKFIWPGKSKRPEIRALERFYAARIKPLAACEVIETRAARGLDESLGERIKDVEGAGLEKRLGDDYIICLSDRGTEMTSREFAEFIERRELESGRPIALVVGGFLGLGEKILSRADLRLSLSRMTFSHELCRVVLMEQVYRALTIIRGRQYAK